MSVRAVTIAGPDGRKDLHVPAETPIRELIPTLVEFVVDEAQLNDGREPVFALSDEGRRTLPSDRTLEQCGIADGAVLVLTEVRPATDGPPKPSRQRDWQPRRGTPLERAQSVLPEQIGRWTRFKGATNAFFNDDEADMIEEPEPGMATPAALTVTQRPSGSQRARSKWRETDYHSLLDARIASYRLRRCATIAVVSPKGGVGKTTITALLGSLLALVRRDRIVALDTNPDYGSLGPTLTPEHRVYVDDLLDILEHPNLTVTELDANLGRASDGLMVLPAPTDPERMRKLDRAAYTKVIERLRSLVGVLVLDCGTGLQEPAAQAAMFAADQIVLVSDSEPATASLVADAARVLQKAGPPIVLAVNKMPQKGARIDLERFGAAVPEAAGMVVVPTDLAGASSVANGEFAWRDAPPGWNRSVRELAIVLMADWPELGISD